MRHSAAACGTICTQWRSERRQCYVTVRGRFDGKTIELLEPPPVDEETFVLVTFLEGPLETAAARESRRAVSVAMF